MIIRISRVRVGGESLAYKTITRVEDKLYRGLKPLPGINLVAGVTGSGKTLLAEALWLGVGHMLSNLLGGQFRNALVGAAGAYGIRPIDAEVEICISRVEVPELKRKTCIKTEISRGLESWTEIPKDAVGNDKLRRSLIYALLHVVSVPDGAKWRIVHAVGRLHRLLAAEDLPRELCLAVAALMPPVDAGRYTPCYVRTLSAPGLRLEEEDGHLYATASHGETSYTLFEAAYEIAYRLSKLAREEAGISIIPLVYIDDAFEGLDATKIKSLLSRDYGDVSIYAATHRIEAGAYTTRNFMLTYGTKASQLVEQPADFRFALVDTVLVEMHKEIFEDVSRKLLNST
jgi:hypothetical protein